jgi:hypothetical protein
MFDFPPHPELPENDAGEETTALRYDDVTQDGRVRLEASWRPMGRQLWTRPEPSRVLGKLGEGVSTVLARVVMQATEVRVVPRSPMRTRVRFRFEHTANSEGLPNRILFNTWTESTVTDDDNAERLVGRSYGQRVFTRLNQSNGDRAITRLEGIGDGIPPHRSEWEPVLSILDIPDGAELLDPVPRLEPSRVVFGLSHTDGNQHVNFLAYPKFVEQAALGRFVDLGLGSKWMARRVELGYRRAAFAGDVLRVAVQAFRVGEAFGVVAALVEQNAPPEGAWPDFGPVRSVARMILRS